MDDLSSVLSSIMENPEALEQLKNTASMLFGGMDNNEGSEQEQNAPASKPSGFSNDFKKAEGDILPLIAKIAPLLSSYGKEDESTRLLNALRPFLGDERKRRLDEGMKMLHIMRLLPLLKDQNIL